MIIMKFGTILNDEGLTKMNKWQTAIVASGPMITTLNDLVAVVAYYGTSWIFLLNVLKLG